MQHFNGLYTPQSGTVSVGPFKVTDQADMIALRRYACYVFQNPNYQLFSQYVGDEIAYGLKLQERPKDEIREKVKAVMNWIGLDFEQFKDRLTQSLSGGERRKVALASMLILNPTLLLLDEPTAGLDPFSRKDVRTKIKSLQEQGKSILVSSHHLDDLAILTDHISLINSGTIVKQDETREILSNESLLAENQMIAPLTIQITAIMRENGWNISGNPITPQELVTGFSQMENDHG